MRRNLLFLAVVGLLVSAAAGPVYCATATTDGSPAAATPTPTPQAADPAEVKHVVLRAPGSPVAADGAAKLTPGESLYKQASRDSRDEPVNWSVMIYKSRHELVVYFEGRFFKKYSAVFGRNPVPGRKEWSEDRRTPEGVYSIIEKEPTLRFHWFLKLNYPNFVDRQRYKLLRARREVPTVDGRVLGVGGSIGIHGTDVPVLNRGLVNWTTGCISVSNRSVDELDRLLPIGTLVIISP